MTKDDLKAKIKEVMLIHLSSKGYPNLTHEQILQELKPMWLKIEEAKLIQSGMSFQHFVAIAHHKYQEARADDLFAEIHREFKRRG